MGRLIDLSLKLAIQQEIMCNRCYSCLRVVHSFVGHKQECLSQLLEQFVEQHCIGCFESSLTPKLFTSATAYDFSFSSLRIRTREQRKKWKEKYMSNSCGKTHFCNMYHFKSCTIIRCNKRLDSCTTNHISNCQLVLVNSSFPLLKLIRIS